MHGSSARTDIRRYAIGAIVGLVCGIALSSLHAPVGGPTGPDSTGAAALRGTAQPAAVHGVGPGKKEPAPPRGTRGVSQDPTGLIRRLMSDALRDPWHVAAPTELVSALEALVQCTGKIPLPLFEELLRHPVYGFRYAALPHWRHAEPDARKLIEGAFLTDGRPFYRRQVLELLLQDAADRRSLLLNSLRDRDAPVRAFAAAQLADADSADPSVRSRLLELLEDPDPTVRSVLLRNLDRFGSAGVGIAMRILNSGDHSERSGTHLARIVVKAGRARDLLAASPTVDTAVLVLRAIEQEVDLIEDVHLVANLKGELELWFGRTQGHYETLGTLAALAAHLGDHPFLQRLLDDKTGGHEGRSLVLEAVLDCPRTRTLAIEVASRWLRDPAASVSLRCAAVELVSTNLDEQHDPEFGDWQTLLQHAAIEDPSFWVRAKARAHIQGS